MMVLSHISLYIVFCDFVLWTIIGYGMGRLL